MGLDADMRTVPALVPAARIAREAKIHLGLAVDASGPAGALRPGRDPPSRPRQQGPRRERSRARAVEARARELLLVERPCPAVPGSPGTSDEPSARAGRDLRRAPGADEEAAPSAALVALHDDLLLADAAVTAAPPPRTGLLSHPEDDVVDALRRTARERPVLVIGVALAAELLYGEDGSEARLRAWRALGEAPLDIVAHGINGAAL